MAAATVIPFSACFVKISSFSPCGISAARSHILSVPVVFFTKLDGLTLSVIVSSSAALKIIKARNCFLQTL